MTELKNPHPGPTTEEGKQHSSQNALKHGLFATKSFLLPGEDEAEYDRHLYRYNKEYNPKGPSEEDMVRHLAQTEWRRRRIPALEAVVFEKAIQTGDPDFKTLNNLGLYDQRFNRDILATLKALKDIQLKRKKETASNFRIACILYKQSFRDHTPWNPADDGFVFSRTLLHQRLQLLDRLMSSIKEGPDKATDAEIDIFISQNVM